MNNKSLINQLEVLKRLHTEHISQLSDIIDERDQEIRDLKEEVNLHKAEITRLRAPKPTQRQRAHRSGIYS